MEALEAKSDRSRVTHEALLDAFVDLLGERPYAQIGVAHIAARAGLTTGAIYSRFGSKQGVVLALHTRFVEHWIGTMESWAAQPCWSSASPQADHLQLDQGRGELQPHLPTLARRRDAGPRDARSLQRVGWPRVDDLGRPLVRRDRDWGRRRDQR